jgi:hypothetical protein
MTSLSATASATATAVTDEFFALICADEQLLQAEFDAIIAAGWPTPPRRPKPATPRPPGRSNGRQQPNESPLDNWPDQLTNLDAFNRQRSPPRATAPQHRPEGR